MLGFTLEHQTFLTLLQISDLKVTIVFIGSNKVTWCEQSLTCVLGGGGQRRRREENTQPEYFFDASTVVLLYSIITYFSVLYYKTNF